MIITDILILLALLIQLELIHSYYDSHECGKSFFNENLDEKKVMGGLNVDDGEFPGVVAIFIHGQYMCSGALISRKHVLTAAHCFLKNDNSPTVLTNVCKSDKKCIEKKLLPPNINKELCPSNCLNKDEIFNDVKVYVDKSGCLHGFDDKCNRTKYEQEFNIIDIHDSYYEFMVHGCHISDITVLTLNKEIDLKNSGYFCVSQFDPEPVTLNSFQTVAVGWGFDPIQNKTVHEYLQKIDVGLPLERSECVKYRGVNFASDGICVSESPGVNTCQGDSGGPLIVMHNNKQYIAGILSIGTSCTALRNGVLPTVAGYSRIDFHLKQLQETIHFENLNFNFTDIDFSDIKV